MSEGEDQSSKTEEPSQKKLEDALEKGQVPHSREVNNFLMLLFLTILVIMIMPYTLSSSATTLRFLVENAGNIHIDQGITYVVLKKIFNKFILYLMPIFLTAVLVALFSSYFQHGEFVFTTEQLMPQLSRISIIGGFKRLFSKKSLVEFLKNLCKVTFVGIFLYVVISSDIKDVNQYQELSVGGILSQLRFMVNNVLICVCMIMAVIAVFDLFYQRFEHFNSLKMTKQEIKDEYKQTEGSPEIKRKIRSLRREQSQKRIKQTVPKSTVVITNPEHFAVALYYDQQSKTTAPIVVAKGLDLIAQKIKEIANEHDVPIVENPPLARILYKQVRINEEIPVEHYEAVAKVISYVMSLNQQKRKKIHG